MEELEQATASLIRIQNFDPKELEQRQKLGSTMNFEAAVKPAQTLIALFKKVPAQDLEQFPVNILSSINRSADRVYNIFENIKNFELDTENPSARRDSLIKEIGDQYQGVFNELHPIISYSTSILADFSTLRNEGRSAVQSIQDSHDNLSKEFDKYRSDLDSIVDEARKVAAERGVSQEAYHFAEQAKLHETEANIWKRRLVTACIAIGIYGIIALFLHKIPFITPVDWYETIHFLASKIVILFVLLFALFLCAKN